MSSSHRAPLVLSLALAGWLGAQTSRPETSPASAKPIEAVVAELGNAAASRPSVLKAIGRRAQSARDVLEESSSAPATESRAARVAEAKKTLDAVAQAMPSFVPLLESN